jgi:hypothetical protein
MFIDTEGSPKTRAPEERNVVSDDSNQQHAAPPELQKTSRSMLAINIASLRDGACGWETLFKNQKLRTLLRRKGLAKCTTTSLSKCRMQSLVEGDNLLQKSHRKGLGSPIVFLPEKGEKESWVSQ